jgi:hypothetical protein
MAWSSKNQLKQLILRKPKQWPSFFSGMTSWMPLIHPQYLLLFSSMDEDKNLAAAILQAERKGFAWTEEHSLMYRNSVSSKQACSDFRHFEKLSHPKKYQNCVGDLFVRLLDSNRCR